MKKTGRGSSNKMSLVKTLVKGIFFLSFVLFLILSFYKPSLPDKSSIIPELFNNEPKQELVSKEPFTKNIKGFEYKLFPKFSYELYGLVVSQYDAENWLDFSHKEDPGNIKDICVVWGENIENESYKKVQFKSGEFTCFYRWKGNIAFSNNFGSNNHLIPANEKIAALIKKAAIGDQIYVKGYLVDYSVSKNGQQVYQRSTSISRDDLGSGACEILYAEDFEILRESNLIIKSLKKFIPLVLVSSFIVSAIFFFIT